MRDAGTNGINEGESFRHPIARSFFLPCAWLSGGAFRGGPCFRSRIREVLRGPRGFWCFKGLCWRSALVLHASRPQVHKQHIAKALEIGMGAFEIVTAARG